MAKRRLYQNVMSNAMKLAVILAVLMTSLIKGERYRQYRDIADMYLRCFRVKGLFPRPFPDLSSNTGSRYLPIVNDKHFKGMQNQIKELRWCKIPF